MTQAQLFEFFKDNGIGVEEVAAKTGYAVLYITNLIYGQDRLNDRARFRILKAFPKTAVFLLPEAAPAPSGPSPGRLGQGNGGEEETHG